MSGRPGFTGFLLLCAAFVLASCDSGSVTFRYRLTLDVQTPEGLRTGSSIIEVRTSPSGPLHPGGIVSRVRGEAVAVDLGSRGVLFALLTSEDNPNNAAGMAPNALQPGYPVGAGNAAAWFERLRALRDVSGRGDVPEPAYPMLVRFGDLRNPLTV